MPSARSKKDHYPGSYHWLKKHKESAGRRKSDVASPTSSLPLPIVEITKRFYDSTILETLLQSTVKVDFDTSVEADLVDLAFAEQHALKIASFSAPALAVIGGG